MQKIDVLIEVTRDIFTLLKEQSEMHACAHCPWHREGAAACLPSGWKPTELTESKTRPEAAALLMVSARTITRWRQQGKLAFVHNPDGQVLYPLDSLRERYRQYWGANPSF